MTDNISSSRSVLIKLISFAVLSALCVFLLCGCGVEVAGEPEPVPPAAPAREEAPDPRRPELDAPYIGALYISEISPRNGAIPLDETGAVYDWLELVNDSADDIDLSLFSLSQKDYDTAESFSDAVLSPGGRIVVYLTGKTDCREDVPSVRFAASADETITLFGPGLTPVSSVCCPDCGKNAVFTADADGVLTETIYPTPGEENTLEAYIRLQSASENTSPLAINEVMTYNTRFLRQDKIGYPDWVEIKNVSGSAVNLGSYYLSDSSSDLTRYRLPDMVLDAGECTVILCCSGARVNLSKVSSQHPICPFPLDSGSESLFLSSDSRVIDSVWLRGTQLNCSYGRLSGENGWFFFTEPTPGSDNRGGKRYISETPVCDVPSGSYPGGFEIALSAPGEIHYTTDGSQPTEYSRLYTGPLKVKETSVVRAVSLEAGGTPSQVLTLNYIIGEDFELPVLCLSTDDPGYFRTIYSRGQKYSETPGNISYFDSNGSFSINCGILMSGDTSLKLDKKNMTFKFRSAYGAGKLNYDIFGGGLTEFEDLTVRAGQDIYRGIIRNDICQDLCLDFTDKVISQRGQYCNLYINGAYRGVYCLKEKINYAFLASMNGVSKDSVTINKATVKRTMTFWTDVLEFILNNDMSVPANYDFVCSKLDIDSFIDWLIIEGYSANSDIQSGNLKYYKSTENDGKWRLIFYDLDASLAHTELTFNNILEYSGKGNIKQITLIAQHLFKNPDFTDRFLTRLDEALDGPLSNEAALAVTQRLTDEISHDIKIDFQRTGINNQVCWNNYLKIINGLFKNDYRQVCINNVARLLRLSAEDVEHYFG